MKRSRYRDEVSGPVGPLGPAGPVGAKRPCSGFDVSSLSVAAATIGSKRDREYCDEGHAPKRRCRSMDMGGETSSEARRCDVATSQGPMIQHQILMDELLRVTAELNYVRRENANLKGYISILLQNHDRPMDVAGPIVPAY